MQLSRFSTVSASPALMPATLASKGMGARALSEATTIWSIWSSPRSTASRIKRAVITLVRLAG